MGETTIRLSHTFARESGYGSAAHQKLTAPTVPATPFPQYDVTVPIGPIPPGPFNPPFTLNTRTPFDTTPPEPPLPANINGVLMQDVINDPILLLQKDIQQLVAEGYTFEGTSLNIATATPLTFLTTANSGAAGPKVPVTVPQFGGGIENIQFLTGESPVVGGKTELQENAETAIVYATFWIEKATHKTNGHTFMQLQYTQLVGLNFPIFHLLNQNPPVYVKVALQSFWSGDLPGLRLPTGLSRARKSGGTGQHNQSGNSLVEADNSYPHSTCGLSSGSSSCGTCVSFHSPACAP
jgi:hypothetical protein